MKALILSLTILVLGIHSKAQTLNCAKFHNGNYKITTAETGTTFIKRSRNIQIEDNSSLGYKIIFDVKWINNCTYELRPKKLIMGDPAIMGNGSNVLTNRIIASGINGYSVEVSSNFFSTVLQFEVEIVK